MALKISLNIEGYKEAVQALSDVKDVIVDFKPVLQDISTYLLGQFAADFTTRGQLIGENWPPLSPKYQLWKANKFPGAGILERTGFMAGAFELEVGDTEAVISNLAPYANFHQQDDDGPAGGGKIPRRRFMAVGPIQQSEIELRLQLITAQRIQQAFAYVK